MSDIFLELLGVGEVGENLYHGDLKYRDLKILNISEGNVPERDIVYINSRGVEVSAEIKTCRYDSPNLALEAWSGNKQSGYLTTKAYFYVIVSLIDRVYYIAISSKLRDYMSDREHELSMVESRLSGNGTTCFLLPKSDFLKARFKVIPINEEVYQSNINEINEVLKKAF